jgi:1-acyl-sn-glycerol-3-phosphate acyltransferase
MLDGPLAAAVIPQPFCGLMNHWHFRIPGYGWLMQLGKSIPVYPRNAGRTAEITEAARERAAEGISILTFPEGHRTLDGNVRPYRRGAFFMARDAAIPVVPMVVRGLYEVNRKGTWMFEPGLVQVYLGTHVETAGLDDDAVSDLAERFTRFADTWVRAGRADVEVLR